MKTLKHKETGSIRRVENKEADFLTSGKNPIWGFVPKTEWKSNPKTNVVETPQGEEASKRTKASKKNDEKKNRKNN
jgi:hypothetical protein